MVLDVSVLYRKGSYIQKTSKKIIYSKGWEILNKYVSICNDSPDWQGDFGQITRRIQWAKLYSAIWGCCHQTLQGQLGMPHESSHQVIKSSSHWTIGWSFMERLPPRWQGEITADTSEKRWPRLLLVSWMYHPRTMTWQHLHLRSNAHLWFLSDHLKGWCERNKISIFSSNSLANMAFWISLTSQYLPPFSLKLWCLSRFILWFWVSGNQSVGIQWSCLMHMKCPWPRMGTSHTSLVSSGQKWQDCSFNSFLPGFYIDPLVSSMEVHCSSKNGGELMMWEAQLARIHWNLFAVCMSPHMSACQCMLTSGFWASHSFDLSTSIC